MARLLRRKRRSAHALTDIPLTPLIDVALTLLIIFMVTTPIIQNSIKVNLPEGKAKEAGGTQQEYIVYIDKDEHMFFNEIPVTKDTLINTIKKKIGNDSEKTVFVKADSAVKYGYVIQVVDQIKVVGGIKYVALATKKLT
jgi:biopolymer transport protein ExbD